MPAAKTCEHARPAAWSSANVAVLNGDHDRAQQLYDESIEVSRRAGETWGLGILLVGGRGLRIVRDDFDQARAQASEAMSLCQELEDPRGIAWSLEVFAGLLAAGGHADGAARLWGASEGLLDSVGGSLAPNIRWIRDRYIEPVKTSLGRGTIRGCPRRGARDAARAGDCARAASGESTGLNLPDVPVSSVEPGV